MMAAEGWRNLAEVLTMGLVMRIELPMGKAESLGASKGYAKIIFLDKQALAFAGTGCLAMISVI